jgi:peptide/nickel transport system substrate-binding protein
MRRHVKVVALALVLGLGAVACSDDDGGSTTDTQAATEETTAAATDDTTAAPQAGGEIVIALGSEPTSLDPQLVDDGGERAINDNVYETLLVRNADGELEPGLAAEMPTQVDDTTWEIKLREGVKFHDGTDFNADAVVATVSRMVKLIADGKTDNNGFFQSFTGAEAVDATTVRITTAEKDGVVPARLYWMKIIPAAAAESADLSESVVGTGPYKLASREKGVNIVLEANADYWGGAPALEKVTYEFIDDSATRLAGLKSGKYQLITNLAPQDTEQAPKVATAQGQEHPVLILDADDGITSDVNVRKALNLAVDKEAIAETLFGGFAVVDAGQLLSPSILGHNESLTAYPYDPEQAKTLLEEAGAAGKSIQLVGESGRWLKDKELLEAVAGYWKEAGLDVKLEILEFGAYLDVLFDRDNRADAIYVSSSNDILDPDRQLSTYYQAGGIGSSNTDQALSDLITAGRSELDAAKRDETYQEAVKIAYDNAYFVWLVNNQDIYGTSENLVWTPRVDSKLLVKEMSLG